MIKPAHVFTSVLILALAAPAFADWEGCSIGPQGQSSIQVSNASNFTLTASGNPLDGATDSIGFASGQSKLNGDCQIIARVARITPGQQDWATGGLMMRESLGGGSKFVALGCTRMQGVQSFVRSEDSGAVSHQLACADCTPPLWLKIVRTGNHIAGYKSNDGSVWLQVFATDVAMKKMVWVGVFATNGGSGPDVTLSFERAATRENAPSE